MANEIHLVNDNGKSHSHQKYVAAQGNVVLRALPQEAQAQIRHCEIALVEENERPQDYRYFVVTSETLFVVERTGSPPRMQSIPFSSIQAIEQKSSGADYLADANIQACSRQLCIAYGREPLQIGGGQFTPDLAQRRRSSGFFATTRNPNSRSDPGPQRGLTKESHPVLEPFDLEYLALVTLEKQSKLYFHLWHAWIGFHVRQTASQNVDTGFLPTPPTPRHVPGRFARSSEDGQASTRGLFRELQDCILADRSRWDNGRTMALEELAVAGETSPLIKRLFFESDVLFKFLTSSFPYWLAQATIDVESVPSTRSAQPLPSSSRRHTTDVATDEPLRQSLPRQSSGHDQGLPSQQDRRTSGPGVTIGETMTAGRTSRVSSETESRVVVLRWDRLLRRLAQARAGLLVLHVVDCVARVLSNSEGIPSRLNPLNAGSPHSLDLFLLDVFLMGSLDWSPPSLPPNSASKQQALTRTVLREDASVDLAAALLFEADSLDQHAVLEGVASEADYVLWALRKAPEPLLRRRLSVFFRRLIKLLSAPAAALDGLRLFKLAHTLTLLLPGVPGGVAHVREEFEEEIRYVLQSPGLQLKLQKRGDFFVQQSRGLVAEIIRKCSADTHAGAQVSGHRRTGSLA